MAAELELEVLRTVVGISALVFTAKILGGICERFRIPEVVGEVCAGIVLGPLALGGVIRIFGGALVKLNDLTLAFFEIAGIIVLFAAGLEFTFAHFRASGGPSFVVGTTGVIIPFLLGYLVPLQLGFPWEASLLIGATLTATSIAITVRVLEDLKQLHSDEGQIMVNAALIDDVLGLAVLAVITSILQFGVIPEFLQVVRNIVVILVMWIALLLVSVFALPRLINLATLWRSKGTVEAAATASCFGLALTAAALGLSPIVGAFAAGMAIAGAHAIIRIRDYVDKLKMIFGPLFFAVIGAFLDPREILGIPFLIVSVILAVAVTSKILGCGLPAAYFLRDADKGLRVGIGMASRGEVGFLIAGLGLTTGVITGSVYTALITVTLGTTIVSPILLRRTFENPFFKGRRLRRVLGRPLAEKVVETEVSAKEDGG